MISSYGELKTGASKKKKTPCCWRERRARAISIDSSLLGKPVAHGLKKMACLRCDHHVSPPAPAARNTARKTPTETMRPRNSAATANECLWWLYASALLSGFATHAPPCSEDCSNQINLDPLFLTYSTTIPPPPPKNTQRSP